MTAPFVRKGPAQIPLDPEFAQTTKPRANDQRRDQSVPPGMIRVYGVIPIALNERFKTMARQQGIHVGQFIGELLVDKGEPELSRLEATQEIARLKHRLGDNWLALLSCADQLTRSNG